VSLLIRHLEQVSINGGFDSSIGHGTLIWNLPLCPFRY
jgi:hypothetical protein